MIDTPLFSIIVPVYNVENYLRKCIDSILIQTFDNYELIIVDDGATDNSGIICDEYAGIQNIHVIHKDNGGLSSARNAGLDVARGKYVLFMDSDDYWDNPNALRILADKISHSKSDIILYGYKKINLSDGKYILRNHQYDLNLFKCEDRKRILLELYDHHHFPGASWLICTKRTLIEEIGLRFPENVTSEDLIWINNLLMKAGSIDAVNAPFYVYVNGRNGQITGTPTVKGLRGMGLAVSEWLHSCEFGPGGISRQMAHVYLVMLMHFSQLSRRERREIIPTIKECSPILKYGTSRHHMIEWLNHILSFRAIGWMISKLYHIKLYVDSLKAHSLQDK